MLLLTTTTDVLELQTTAALSTDWTASWVDIDYVGGSFVPGSAEGNTAVAGVVVLAPSPGAGLNRQLKYLSVLNRDVSTQTIVIQKNAFNLTGAWPLEPGWSLQYIDSHGFQLLDGNGAIQFVGSTGATGPTGATGAQGPPGTNASTTYTFNQTTPVSVWTVAHNLGRFPSATVVDSANNEVDGDLQYIDSNNLTLTFSAPFSGEAYLN